MADDNPGVVGAARDLGRDLIAALPPAFLLLVLLNVAFLGLVMWFLDYHQNLRTELLTKFADHCFAIMEHSAKP